MQLGNSLQALRGLGRIESPEQSQGPVGLGRFQSQNGESFQKLRILAFDNRQLLGCGLGDSLQLFSSQVGPQETRQTVRIGAVSGAFQQLLNAP